MPTLDELCEVLGVGPDATVKDVEKAYGELAKVWSPERFQNDDRIREKAEKKMTEVKAARDALLDILRSGRGVGSRGEIDPGAPPLSMACDNPRCSGVLDRDGICNKCGKYSARRSFRYVVFCPACGTRNVIAGQKDYDRGICAGCRRPLGVPLRLEQKSFRKTAYLVFLVVITTLVWFFFASERPQYPAAQKKPLNTRILQSSNNIPAERAAEAEAPPGTESDAHQVRSTSDLTVSGHSAGEHVEENGGSQPVEQAPATPAAEGKESKTVEKAETIPSEAPQNAKPSEVRPISSDEGRKENYDRLIDEIAKKKKSKREK